MSVVHALVRRYVVPLPVAPVGGDARPDGDLTSPRGLLVSLNDGALVGWGDAAPWPGFGGRQGGTIAEAVGSLEASWDELLASGVLTGWPTGGVDEARAFTDGPGRTLPPELRHAIELALLDLAGKRQGRPLYALLGGAAPPPLQSHRLVVGDAPRAGTLKVKLRGTPAEDLARLAATRAQHPDAEIRVDAGGAWAAGEAVARIEAMTRLGVTWFEQPRCTLAELAALRRDLAAAGIGARVVADEAVTGMEALEALIAAEAADAVVLKPMFVGGLLTAQRLAARAREVGLSFIVTHALDSAVGRAGAAHLAAAIAPHAVHGLLGPEATGELVIVAGEPGHGVDAAPLAPPVQAPEPDALSIPHPLPSAAAARPAHPALITDTRTWSAEELLDAVRRQAAALARSGVRAGQLVALDGTHQGSDGWLVALHALGWLGAAVAPLAPTSSREERRHLLTELRPDAVLAAAADAGEGAGDEAAPERFWPLTEARLWVATSGTTGRAKTVPLSTHAVVLSAFGSAIRLGHDPADRWLCCLPLHHVGGLSILLRCLFYGTTAVVHRGFDAHRVNRAIDGGGVTLVSLVPTMLARVLEARGPRRFPPTLRAILLGGSAAPEALLARCRALSVPVACTWGMTESASQIATALPGPPDGAALPPLPFVRVHADGERLAVEGPLVGGGRCLTADRGRLDGHGRVVVEGRADDVIVSGGEKVAAGEIERVLVSHPAVAEAVVVGVASARWGQRPVAALVARGDGPPPDDEALRRFCRAHLAAFKAPDGFLWLPALPRTELGKPARHVLTVLAEDTLRERLDHDAR